MASDWSFMQSLISAASGLAGVWLGKQLTSKHEEARESERIRKESSYLAILVVAHLDRFANGCLYIALDDGTTEGRPAGQDGQFYMTTVKAPTVDPLALDVNWKALPADMMYEILSLPYQTEELERHIGGTREFDDPPEYTEYFWARQHGYAVLGLEVSELARRLREHASLPISPRKPGEWNRDTQLRAQRDKIIEERQAYESRCVARQ